MSPEQFEQLAAAGYNRIPLLREVLADLDTPLSTYRKLAAGPYSYLLESVQGGDKWGRYSIIGLPCETYLSVTGRDVSVVQNNQVIESASVADPLAFVEEFQQRYKVPEIEGLPRFSGGMVGYFGYDIVRYIEPRLDLLATTKAKPDTIGTPDILLMVSTDLIVFDNLRGTLFVVTHADPTEQDAYQKAQQRLQNSIDRLEHPAPRPKSAPCPEIQEHDFISGFPQADFEAAVDTIKEYVLAGDVMQVVIAQRLSVPFQQPALDLYRALRCLNPSPYLYYLDLDQFYIVGSSPEILARVEGDTVSVRPIAGTRRRGHDEADDLVMEQDLLNDPKEIAEHLMLIDLGRNDVGRIAETGSVTLTDKMMVERYSHVMHIVSNVEGRLRQGKSAMDVLRATFPAGTLSGAPKIRAMEIIEETEPVKRGIYGGAVGYLAWNGDMDTAIAIRTAVIKDQQLHIQAGAGVVADSQPHLEWKETNNKARAVFKAAAMATDNLTPNKA